MPVYRRPSNLFVRGTTQSSAGLPNKGQVFRKIGRRKLVPYYDRAEIEDGAIDGRGLEICYLKEQTDLLFAQIQGSARISLDDGSTVRINYDAHNGYPYTAVGRILIERNIIPREQMSMQKIREWMEENPNDANELRRQNRSYVFFREVKLSDKDEAVGAQGVPLTAGRSIAVDKALHVYGTPFFIEGELPIEIGAIQDAVSPADDRAGHGLRHRRSGARRSLFRRRLDAGKVAGRLRHNARFVMLVPKSLDPVARGRKLPVPDARPSEKIAKLFPQIDPLKKPPKVPRRRTPGRRRRQHRRRQQPGLRKPRHPGSCRKAGAASRAAAEGRSGFDKAGSAPPAPISPSSMKRRRPELDSRTAGAAATQARPERRGPRAVGERRQAGQAAAQAARFEITGRHRRKPTPRRAKICCLAKTRRAGSELRHPQNHAAAAGADRPPRALASVARPEGDRRPDRSARHDADAGASRAVRFPAARPS